MCYRATHRIRFFNVVYNTSKGSYIERCIDIGIHMASTVVALKVLVGSFAQMFTYIADLRGVARIYNHHRDSIEPSLILQKEAKLSERPSSQFGSEGFISWFRREPNTGQILNSDSFALFFSGKDNRFCNGMIDNLSVSSFFAFEPLRQLPAVPFGRTLGSVCLCLKRTPNLLPMFTVGIKLFSRMHSAIRGYDYIRDTKITTYILLYLRSIPLGNLHRLMQEKLPLLVHQLSFPFPKGKIVRVMANKLNLLPAAKIGRAHV